MIVNILDSVIHNCVKLFGNIHLLVSRCFGLQIVNLIVSLSMVER